MSCLIIFSCSDQGCIDADDFGEYESQTIAVEANASEVGCEFDSSKDITDPAQGSQIKTCLVTTTAKRFTDSNNQEVTSNTGCSGFSDAVARQFCVDDCVSKCKSSAEDSAGGSEPNWKSTSARQAGRNDGVTIKPGSQIMVRAFGSVSLGDKLNFVDLFVDAKESRPHSKKINSNDPYFLDVRGGQSLLLDFSGRWKDGADSGPGGNIANNNIGATPLASSQNDEAFPIDSNVINGGRRLVAYLTPHQPGYEYDSSKTTEKERAKGVLLLPDRNVWKCNFTTGSAETESICANSSCTPNPYIALGYTNSSGTSNVDCEATSLAFPITSAGKSNDLGKYGGLIRWSGDGLLPENNDPFLGINCNSSSECTTALSAITQDKGKIVGNLDGRDVDYTNNNDYALKVSFRLLSTSPDANVCNNLSLVVRNANDSDIYSYTTFNNPSNPIAISQNWSGGITLEKGYKLHIQRSSTSFGAVNCGEVIAMKFGRYHDIEIENSGFVSFSTLDGNPSLTTQACNIKARIINKAGGSYANYNSSYSADFYEYDDFNTSNSTDPLANLNVLNSGWTEDVFVRKGQFIRFSPESWNQTWSSVGGTRRCGIGMAMSIDPRPAVLCRGRQTDKVLNPECTPKYNTEGRIVGCQATSNECNTPNTPSYCVASCTAATSTTEACTTTHECKSTVSCSDNATDPLVRQNCNLVLPATAPAGVACSSTCGTRPIVGNPTGCDLAIFNNANKAAYKTVSDLDQCYDLEDYLGKVSNIPAAGFSEVELASEISKGAKKIGAFNGYYGNFENLIDSGKNDSVSNNRIFTLRTPQTFTRGGRLRFFVVDGADFKTIKNNSEGSYSNNGSVSSSASTNGFNGDNGYKISPSTFLEFQNGEWLEAKLCEDEGNDVRNCELAPVQVDGQRTIIQIDNSSSLTLTPIFNSSSAYRFDVYGNIIKKGATTTLDCQASPQGIISTDGSLFYCHTKYFYPSTASDTIKAENNAKIANLRLTFKIKDPEVNNCIISTGSQSCGGNLAACDGIKKSNPIYETGSGRDGLLCAGATELPYENVPTGKTSCKKQFYCVNKYANNSGRYYVAVRVKSPSSAKISGIIGQVVEPVIEIMDGKPGETIGQSERMYKLLINDGRYKFIVKMCLVLMFSFYGFGYLMGVSELNHSEILNRVIKIGLIYLMIQENGWFWFDKFFVETFKNGTDYLAFTMASAFDNSPELATAIANNDFYDKSILFGSSDRVFGLFFSQAVQKKISALLFASLFGWVYLLIIYYAFMSYVYAICNAVLIYLTAQVFISILFTLGPIFFVFTLFNQTKEMFDNWLKQLISFSLQQVFLLTTVAFFNLLMYEVIKMSLGYKICWDEVWTINIITRISLLSFWTIASMPPRTTATTDVANIGNPEGIPSIFSILYIWVIASLMNKFVTFMSGVAASIGGGIEASSLGSGIKSAANNIGSTVNDYRKKAWRASGGQVVQRMDKALFDSGQMAKDERTRLKKQDAADSKSKSAMSDAGKEALSKYKKEHGAELAGKSKEEQRKTLSDIRSGAMDKAGKDLGLSDSEITRLKSDSGVHYRGNNVIGLALKAGKEGIMGGRTLGKSIEDKKVSTKFSQKEAKAALKNTDEAGRKQFMERAASGHVKVEKLLKSKIADSVAFKVATAPVKMPLKAVYKGAKAVVFGGAKGIIGAKRAYDRGGMAEIGRTAAQEFRDTKASAKDAVKRGKDAVARGAKTVREGVRPANIKAAIVSGYKGAKGGIKSIGAEKRAAVRAAEMSGEVSRGTFNFARTAAEKKVIADKMKEMRAARKVDGKMNDARALRSLREVADVEQDKTQSGKTSRVRAEGSVAARLLGRRKGLKGSIRSAKNYHTDGDGVKASMQDPIKAGLAKRLDEQEGVALGQRSRLEAAQKQDFAALRAMKPQHDAMAQQLRNASDQFKAAPTPENRANLESAKKAFQSSPLRADMISKQKDIHARNEAMGSVNKRLERIREDKSDMAAAAEIKEVAAASGMNEVVDKYNNIRDVDGFRKFRNDHAKDFSGAPAPIAPPAPLPPPPTSSVV